MELETKTLGQDDQQTFSLEHEALLNFDPYF